MDKQKTISKRKIKMVTGILLAIIPIMLCVNVTFLPRIINFPFFYAFGIFSYLIYAIIYFIGMGLIFNIKPIKLKWKDIGIVIGFILILAGLVAVTTNIAANSSDALEYVVAGGDAKYKIVRFWDSDTHINFKHAFEAIFPDKDTYFKSKSLNFFSQEYSIGCGFLGYFALACCNKLFNSANGGITFAIIMFVAAFLIFTIRIIRKVNKYRKLQAKKEEEKAADSILVESSSEDIHPNYESYNGSGYEETKLSDKSFYFNDFEDVRQGQFVAPIFSTSDDAVEINPAPVIHQEEIKQEPIKEEPHEEVFDPFGFDDFKEEVPTNDVVGNNLENEPKIEEKVEHHEQLSLDFNEVNEEVNYPQPEINKPTVSPIKVETMPTNSATVAPKKRERVNWIPVSTGILADEDTTEIAQKNADAAEQKKMLIEQIFADFGIGAHVDSYIVGPAVTRFNIAYDANVSSKAVDNKITDISIRLGGVSARFVEVVEGQNTSGLEIPNAIGTKVTFKEVIDKLPDANKKPLAIGFGKNVSGDVIWASFNEFPHLLVAGTTGSGKSVFVHSVILTLIMRCSPDDLKIVLVDPKSVEMNKYRDMPHLLRPIINEASEAYGVAKKLREEMERRYKLFAESNGAADIGEYNHDMEKSGGEKLPYILFVLDEYADLIDQCKELSGPVVSLAQKARAAGIHMLIATQRPSTNVITGTIKANLPTHVALLTSNATDSITIIGEGGAEKLLGRGDMLVQTPLVSKIGSVRLQGCYASRDEILAVVADLKSRYETHYDENYLNLEEESTQAANNMVEGDEFLQSKDDAEEEKYQFIKEWTMCQEYMSISRIQREQSIGFNRAGRFFLRLQKEGIISDKAESTSKGCKVLVKDKFAGKEVDVASDEQSFFRSDVYGDN